MHSLLIQTQERLADTETPVSSYLKLCRRTPDSFLLESVETREIAGRYSIVAWDPLLRLELWPEETVVEENGGRVTHSPQEFFWVLKELLGALRMELIPSIPAVGSLLGFIGYDAVRLIEPRLSRVVPQSLPIARLVFPSRFAVFDHLRRVLILLALDSDRAACKEKLREMVRSLERPLVQRPRRSLLKTIPPRPERFMAMVERAKEYIREGEILQVVLSDAFAGETQLSPFEVYRRLRVRSPSPYMFYLDFGPYRLVGASPETLVRVRDREVTIVPIAGTRPRSEDPQHDRALERELLACTKESAEHLMLVDLARNDVGRVAEYGSVHVDPYRTVERYSHVMHIVSKVQGRLKEGKDIVDAFMAGFPAGTVSGAPKVRATEIIDELEGVGRGPYAGAVGYFGPGQVTDTCIAIRTILFHEDRFTIRVGAGIVADSDPEMEYQEILSKAAQSLRALQAATRGDS